jgi:hypothetical protein
MFQEFRPGQMIFGNLLCFLFRFGIVMWRGWWTQEIWKWPCGKYRGTNTQSSQVRRQTQLTDKDCIDHGENWIRKQSQDGGKCNGQILLHPILADSCIGVWDGVAALVVVENWSDIKLDQTTKAVSTMESSGSTSNPRTAGSAMAKFCSIQL